MSNPAEVRPLAEIRLAKNDALRQRAVLNQRRVGGNVAAVKRQRARRGLHVVVRRDVVFDQQRNSMQRSADVTGFALVIETGCNRDRIGVRFDHRVQRRIQLLDAIQITSGPDPLRSVARPPSPPAIA